MAGRMNGTTEYITGSKTISVKNHVHAMSECDKRSKFFVQLPWIEVENAREARFLRIEFIELFDVHTIAIGTQFYGNVSA